MEKERKAILSKYKKNVGKIIEKYEKYEDDDLEVFNIFSFTEEPTFCIDSISFIRNSSHKASAGNSTLVLFTDIHKMLCTPCDFEDICRILR